MKGKTCCVTGHRDLPQNEINKIKAALEHEIDAAVTDGFLCLKEHGIKLAVATGLPEKLYIPCLKNNSILELFGALCSTDEVQRGKEYSDVFELAARKLGVAPEHCIVFDDVLPAIKSAKAARMLAGGIYDKYSADQRTEIERIADIYLLDFRQAPIPHKEV